jgi:murein DD-endopeptidase MepM/ murein hydrolase activator NlpD
MKRTPLVLSAVLAIGGCASTPQPVYRTSPYAAPRMPSGPNLFSQVPSAPLHSELFACNGGGGSNVGPVGERGEATLYTPYIHTAAGALLRNPTESACLSSGFGWRTLANGGGREHTGLDLANPNGGFVYAAADGWVSYAEWRGGYGLAVEIDHGHGVRTFYAHLNEIDPNLSSGAFVRGGAAIARMGATGNATGVHLHYEVSIDGLKVDPLNYGAAPPLF